MATSRIEWEKADRKDRYDIKGAYYLRTEYSYLAIIIPRYKMRAYEVYIQMPDGSSRFLTVCRTITESKKVAEEYLGVRSMPVSRTKR